MWSEASVGWFRKNTTLSDTYSYTDHVEAFKVYVQDIVQLFI